MGLAVGNFPALLILDGSTLGSSVCGSFMYFAVMLLGAAFCRKQPLYIGVEPRKTNPFRNHLEIGPPLGAPFLIRRGVPSVADIRMAQESCGSWEHRAGSSGSVPGSSCGPWPSSATWPQTPSTSAPASCGCQPQAEYAGRHWLEVSMRLAVDGRLAYSGNICNISWSQ